MLAYRYEAAKRRPPDRAAKRSSFRRFISIGATPRAASRLGSGGPGPIGANHWIATVPHLAKSVIRPNSEVTDNMVSFSRHGTAVQPYGDKHVARISRTSNKPLHQTRRGGVLASRAVVEARLAGERRC